MSKTTAVVFSVIAAALFVIPALRLTARLERLGRARRLLLASLICFFPIETILVANAEVHRYLGDSLQYAGLLPVIVSPPPIFDL